MNHVLTRLCKPIVVMHTKTTTSIRDLYTSNPKTFMKLKLFRNQDPGWHGLHEMNSVIILQSVWPYRPFCLTALWPLLPPGLSSLGLVSCVSICALEIAVWLGCYAVPVGLGCHSLVAYSIRGARLSKTTGSSIQIWLVCAFATTFFCSFAFSSFLNLMNNLETRSL